MSAIGWIILGSLGLNATLALATGSETNMWATVIAFNALVGYLFGRFEGLGAAHQERDR